MPHGPEIPYFREIAVFLIASVLVVPLLQKLKASPVLGYLAVGVAIGPFGLAAIDDVEGVSKLAELGVVFLLFVIGLELSLERLIAMRRMVFGLGGLQVLLSGTAIGLIAWSWGNSPQAAVILGACLALSSTAIVVQLLVERGEIASRVGRASFSILLFQDLAVVPILILVSVLGQPGDSSVLGVVGLALLRAVAAVVIIGLLGRLLFRPLFRLVAATHSPELFMAMILLAILGTASATAFAGLSMALGAFLAGLLLAETEFRHQVETDIAPFKGLLLGLFFISVGMSIDLAAVADKAFWVAASVVGLIVIKWVLNTAACLAFRLPRPLAAHVGLLLSQGGEFAFLAVGSAMALGIMPQETGQFMLIVASLTMVLTPFLAILGRKVEAVLTPAEDEADLAARPEDFADLENHVIIAGFGRVGQTVAKLLEAQKQPFVALDLDTGRLRQCRKLGLPVFFGDASRRDMLARVGAGRAIATVITLDRPTDAARAVETIHENWPSMQIYARARDTDHSAQLAALGATHTVPETVESSLQLAGQVLHAIGTPMEATHQIIEKIRDDGYGGLGEPVESNQKDR